MPNELVHPAGTSGQTYVAVLRNAAGEVWNEFLGTFGAWSDASIANYAIPLTEQGTSGHFAGDFPTEIVTAGLYSYVVYQRAGAGLALTDSKQGLGTVNWDGAAEIVPPGPVEPPAAIEVDGKSQVEFYRLVGAVLLGELSGAGTGTEVFRALDDAKARVTATTTEEGNRTAVTLDASP
jgi:hypothetical protein